LAKGNSGEQTRFWTQGQIDLQQALDRIRTVARRDKEERFTALWHYVYNVNRLRQAYFALKRDAAPGADEVTWQDYGETLEERLKDLSLRLQRGSYKARPVKRVYIPKPDGRERLAKFNLTLNEAKTRLIEFGRFADHNRRGRGGGKPETFNFLGFTHICGKTRNGKFCVLRQTMAKKKRAKLAALAEELRRRMHHTIAETGAWLQTVLLGHYQYYGVPRNGRALSAFRYHVYMLWRKTLKRRSQKHRITQSYMDRLAQRWLPQPRITHPHPHLRLRTS